MSYRVADITSSNDFAFRINTQKGRLSVLQEQITTGKRINRASDDPEGAEILLGLRTSQTEIKQFQRSSQAAAQKLTAADDTLNSYETILERVRTLVTQGLSDTTTQDSKNALATELETLRTRILNISNTKNNGEYLFGGTRQDAAPFDPSTSAPAASATTSQFVQIEPGANAIKVGVTADTIFSDATSTIFTDLTAGIAALRGTGNAATDRTTLENTSLRLGVYTELENNARAIVGANMNAADIAKDNLSANFLSFDDRANDIEGTDFAATAVALTDAQRALDATLQVAAKGRRSLFDFLG
ncbi:flagellar hook-associated protein FlgL [soil metagenome]